MDNHPSNIAAMPARAPARGGDGVGRYLPSGPLHTSRPARVSVDSVKGGEHAAMRGRS